MQKLITDCTPAQKYQTLPPLSATVFLTSVTGQLHIAEANDAFASPAPLICLGIGNSLGDRHGCCCHHTAIMPFTDDQLISITTIQTMQTASPAYI